MQLPNNTRKRVDCPACSGQNTLIVSNVSGHVTWYCFRNSCGVKGGYKDHISASDIKTLLKQKTSVKKINFAEVLTPQFKPVDTHPDAIYWLFENNCEAALKADPNAFRYDIRQHRVVFVNYDGPYIDVAIGRTLEGAKPKWFKYFGTNGYYVCRLSERDILYIVEDCASACSLARVGTSLALCGTNYDIGKLHARIKELEGINKVYVCLDADATVKALQLTKDLEGICGLPVKTLRLSDDAKYLSLETLAKELPK